MGLDISHPTCKFGYKDSKTFEHDYVMLFTKHFGLLYLKVTRYKETIPKMQSASSLHIT